MANETPCPDEELSAITRALADDEAAALSDLAKLIGEYPTDARLYFLQGSMLAGQGEIDEGHHAMAHAVTLAPDYHVARFQLGLLELSSGDAASAERTWLPLSELADDNFLRLFARGLGHLVRDEFEQCRSLLQRGIRLNDSLPEMNGDMQLVLDGLPQPGAPVSSEETSETQMLLQTFTDNPTRH